MEKYLYFAEKVVKTESISTSNAASNGIQVFRIADGNFSSDVSAFAAGTSIFTTGSIVVDLTVHADHANNFGTHYGTPAASSTVRIHPNALSYDGTQDITVKNKTEDPVFGITMSSTAGNNDIVVSQAKPLFTGDAIALPLSRLLGIVSTAQNKTALTFLPHTNNGPFGNGTSNLDKVVLTHANDKYSVICSMIRDIAGDNTAQSNMIIFADDYEEVYYNNNPAGITDCDLSLDS